MNQHYHLIGIGGIGMAGLASLLMSRGDRVSGSDVKDGPLLAALRQKGAEVFIGHEAGQVKDADVVVYSSAVQSDNPEFAQARTSQIPILRRAELLSRLMEGKTGVTVAGAHGKTTTSAMIAHMLLKSGLNPTIAVGGVIRGLDFNAALGQGEYFVSELDESDGSFLLFHPRISVITNIDFEHVDYYQTWDNIINAYRQFIGQTAPDGTLIACGEDPRLLALLAGGPPRVVTYGFGPHCDLWAQDIRVERDEAGVRTRFRCVSDGRDGGDIALSSLGRHNVLNALACVAAGQALGLDFSSIAQALATFAGVNRRLQKKGTVNEISVYDDYGHHPTEIRATLEAAQGLKSRRLVTVFQPHRYSRLKFLFEDFVSALSQSDVLIITDIYAASEPALEGVSGQHLCERVRATGQQNVSYVKKEDLETFLEKTVIPGDLVLTLGAGDIYKTGEVLLTVLDEKMKFLIEQSS